MKKDSRDEIKLDVNYLNLYITVESEYGKRISGMFNSYIILKLEK